MKKKYASKQKKVLVDYKKLYRNAISQLDSYESRIDETNKKNEVINKANEVLIDQVNLSKSNLDDLKSKLHVYSDYKYRFNILKESLVGCLSDEEKEAAEISGCSKEKYAVELLKIFQQWKSYNRKPSDYGKGGYNNNINGY